MLCFISALRLLAITGEPISGEDISLALLAERERIEVIERAMPSVVCIYDSHRRGGGSGVIIDPEGYGLTNFHVIAGMLGTRRGLGGLSDGKVYDLQVLGIDPSGDVAMFRLTGKQRFDYAELGDSDAVGVGDFVLAMGNPFLLAEDHTPTVTLGIISGVHRYQWGQGNALVYSDCLQTDAAINPGNSGGPLFDMSGRVVGINGRISAASGVRGRFNVGLGYAISANQIKRFVPALRAGLLARHGTLQATVNAGLLFNELLEDGPAWKVGIRPGDRLQWFGGRKISSANQFASILGVYPADWPIPIRYERRGRRYGGEVRLEPLSIGQTGDFEVDPQVNRQAVRRVLSRCRDAVLGKGTSSSDGDSNSVAWSWTSRRVPLTNGENPPRSQQWKHGYRHGGSSVHRQISDDGRVVRNIECADAQARLVENDRQYSLAASEALPVIALHALRERVLYGAAAADLADMTLVGGDEWFSFNKGGALMESHILEVVELELTGNVVIRFGLDADSGMVRRIVAQDRAAGDEAVIDLSGYREFDGWAWPTTLRVSSGGHLYLDQLRDFKRE